MILVACFGPERACVHLHRRHAHTLRLVQLLWAGQGDLIASMSGPSFGGFASTANSRSAALQTGPIEATSVRPKLCLSDGSLPPSLPIIYRQNIVSKRREGTGGRLAGGQRFSRGALYLLLQNRIYRGETVHQGTAYPSQQEAIIDPELWRIVQDKLAARIAGMLAIGLLGTLVVGVFGATLDTRLAELQVPPEIRRALNAEVPKFAQAKVPPQIEGEQRRMLKKVLDESFVRSFRVAMLVAAGLMAAAIGTSLCSERRMANRRLVRPVTNSSERF
jgi:Recombinase